MYFLIKKDKNSVSFSPILEQLVSFKQEMIVNQHGNSDAENEEQNFLEKKRESIQMVSIFKCFKTCLIL